MNNAIYNYFAETYGTVRKKNDVKGLHDKYKDFSQYQFKKELRNLKKDRNSNVYAIKYVSKLTRNVTNKKNNMIIYINDHDKEIKGNVWDYTLLEKDNSGKPTFTKNKPVQIFSNVYLIPQLCYLYLLFHHGLQSLKHPYRLLMTLRRRNRKLRTLSVRLPS